MSVPVGGELIHEVIAAMHKRMTVHELATMPHYHPTLAEIWMYPAEALAEQIQLPGHQYEPRSFFVGRVELNQVSVTALPVAIDW